MSVGAGQNGRFLGIAFATFFLSLAAAAPRVVARVNQGSVCRVTKSIGRESGDAALLSGTSLHGIFGVWDWQEHSGAGFFMRAHASRRVDVISAQIAGPEAAAVRISLAASARRAGRR